MRIWIYFLVFVIIILVFFWWKSFYNFGFLRCVEIVLFLFFIVVFLLVKWLVVFFFCILRGFLDLKFWFWVFWVCFEVFFCVECVLGKIILRYVFFKVVFVGICLGNFEIGFIFIDNFSNCVNLDILKLGKNLV